MAVLPRKNLVKRARPPASELGLKVGGGRGHYGGYFSGPNNTGANVTEESSLALPAVLAGVNAIARDLSALPLRVVQRMPDGSLRQATENPLYDLLKWSPDGGSTPSITWRMTLLFHAIIWGNAFVEIVRDGFGEVASLEIRDPYEVRPLWENDVLGYVLCGVPVPKEKVIHLRGLSRDGTIGYSPILASRQTIGLGLAGQNFAGAYLSNGLQSSGFLQTPDNMEAAAREELAEGIRKMTSGGSAWSIAVMPPGCKFDESSADPDKAQLLAMRRQALLDVCAILNVPPYKVQIYDSMAGWTLEQSELQYVRGTLIPWGEIVEQSFGLRLLSSEMRSDGYEIRHDYSMLTRGDSAARTNYYRALAQNGVITPNDWAIAEGLNPFEGGDKHSVQMNTVAIEDMNEKGVSTNLDAGD